MAKQRKLRTDRIAVAGLLFFLLIVGLLIVIMTNSDTAAEESSAADVTTAATTTVSTTETTTTTTTTTALPLAEDTDILARNAVLRSTNTKTVLADHDADAEIAPASMTKLMTMMVVLDTLTPAQLDGTFVMTQDIITPLRAQNAVCAGFANGESCSITDLLYGTMLPSGADAATALAIYTAGNVDAFADLMNAKAAELGLTHSHFLNPTGLDQVGHYSSANDIAALLEYALQNETARKIMSTPAHCTAATAQHPNGLILQSIVFMRLGDKTINGLKVCGGKTGFTSNAGQCLASWAEDASGNTFICVAAGCDDPMDAIYDTLTIYDRYSGVCDGIYQRPQPPAETTTAADTAA